MLIVSAVLELSDGIIGSWCGVSSSSADANEEWRLKMMECGVKEKGKRGRPIHGDSF